MYVYIRWKWELHEKENKTKRNTKNKHVYFNENLKYGNKVLGWIFV